MIDLIRLLFITGIIIGVCLGIFITTGILLIIIKIEENKNDIYKYKSKIS